jgi:hypothetical protein
MTDVVNTIADNTSKLAAAVASEWRRTGTSATSAALCIVRLQRFRICVNELMAAPLNVVPAIVAKGTR